AAVALGLALFGGCKHDSTEAKPPATTTNPLAPPPSDVSQLTPEQRGRALAKIDDTVITLGEFEDRLLKQSAYIRHRYATRERKTPEQVRASHILIKFPPNATAAQKETAKERAKSVLSEVKEKGKEPQGFSELVKKYSDDTGSKMIGGDLRYFSRTEEGGTM